jgi:trk system potassium uptake protein TrkH
MIIKEGKTKRLLRHHPIRYLVVGYFIITLFFAWLLSLKISSVNGTSQQFIDALFMASSGISTTGLCVVDIGSFYSLFGQIVLMLDFQIGGIGYMAFFVFIVATFKKKLFLTSRSVATESISGAHFGYTKTFFGKVILVTFIIESIGGIILFLFWRNYYSSARALYLGFFHSISAFCTAGFSLFSDSLMSYKNSSTINIVINVVSLAGAIGFYVLNEVYMIVERIIKRERYRRLSTHSKLAILMTIIVLILGTTVLFICEEWSVELTFIERFRDSLFQIVSASTTDGFNTLDIGTLSATSLFACVLLMFIGASPGSTGGGIKTTTLGVVFLTIWSSLKRKNDTNFLDRRVTTDVTMKSFIVFFLFIVVAVIDLLILTVTENAGFLQVLFECISALGNTGLSMGITSSLSCTAKVVLSITMFIGRVGPLTIGLALVSNSTPPNIRYPAEEVYVG